MTSGCVCLQARRNSSPFSTPSYSPTPSQRTVVTFVPSIHPLHFSNAFLWRCPLRPLSNPPLPPYPFQYPVLSLFSFLRITLSLSQSPFLSPLLSRLPFPRFTSATPICLSSVPSSFLRLLAALAMVWEKAVVGRASCISPMHYSCSLHSVLVFFCLFTGTRWRPQRARRMGHRA